MCRCLIFLMQQIDRERRMCPQSAGTPVINVEKPNRIELNAWQIKDLQVNKKTFKVLEENMGGIFMT